MVPLSLAAHSECSFASKVKKMQHMSGAMRGESNEEGNEWRSMKIKLGRARIESDTRRCSKGIIYSITKASTK